MRCEQELRDELQRSWFFYRLAHFLVYVCIAIPFSFAFFMMTIEAFERHFLLGMLMLPFCLLTLYALLFLPADSVQPFLDWKVNLKRRRDLINEEYGNPD